MGEKECTNCDQHGMMYTASDDKVQCSVCGGTKVVKDKKSSTYLTEIGKGPDGSSVFATRGSAD